MGNYFDTLTKLPEEVLLLGFRDILKSYNIELDDYNSRKLMYHILVSIGYFFFHYPDKRIDLEKLCLYRDSRMRNSFVMDMDPLYRRANDANMQDVYDYFIGGIMDFNELSRELDQYSYSYIEYTEKTKSLAKKAYKTYQRYKELKKEYEDAKKILKILGYTNNTTLRTKGTALAKKLLKDKREANEIAREEKENKKLDKEN